MKPYTLSGSDVEETADMEREILLLDGLEYIMPIMPRWQLILIQEIFKGNVPMFKSSILTAAAAILECRMKWWKDMDFYLKRWFASGEKSYFTILYNIE